MWLHTLWKGNHFTAPLFFWLGKWFFNFFSLLLIGIILEGTISSVSRELISCNILAVGLTDVGDQATDLPLPSLLQLKSCCFFFMLFLRESKPGVIKRRRNGKLKQEEFSWVKQCATFTFFSSLRMNKFAIVRQTLLAHANH